MNNLPEILLVELPPWDVRTPPLGIAYLSTFLRVKGVDAEVFDLNIEIYNSESDERKKGWGNEDFFWWRSNELEERYLKTFEHFADRILSFNTPVIGLSITIPSISFLNHLLKCLKKKAPDKVIIVGGPGTFFSETREAFDNGLIDYIVIGEGETALYELLVNLKKSRRPNLRMPSSCRVWRDQHISGKATCIQMPKIMDIDSIPAPTFEEFNLTSYTEGHFTLPVIFSKGCNRRCSFCSDVVLSHPYRCRKAGKVIKEIRTHLRRYGNISTFRLNDLSFNADLRFIHEFCGHVMAEGLQFQWYGQAQVRPDMDEELFLKMKRAGCRQFSLGLESFSDNVLSMMRKGYTAKDAVKFLKASKEAGIENHIAIIVGYPGETEDDFNVTLKYIGENAAYIDRICSLNICGMPAGSELRRSPKKFNYFFPAYSDWVTSNYANTYEIRKKRYNEVITFCDKLGIAVDACLDLEIFEKQFKKE